MRIMSNLVQLSGALAADPNLSKLSDDTYVANFRLRTYRPNKDQGMSYSDQQYFHLVAWGNIALEIERNFRKGDQLLVRGELRNRLQIINEERIYKTEIHVYEFIVLGKNSNASRSINTSQVA